MMDFAVNKVNNKVNVKREFGASLNNVWAAWTQSDLLDQWWAPKPWKAQTKTMDFRPGGHWLYAMVGPEGEKHWARADFKDVKSLKSFQAVDAFCDEQGKPNREMPMPRWQVSFTEQGAATFVDIAISFDSMADMEQYLSLGFQEGFTSALENLDEFFDTK
jgi:uncharacterized protein YndB with AHSA1/START domain